MITFTSRYRRALRHDLPTWRDRLQRSNGWYSGEHSNIQLRQRRPATAGAGEFLLNWVQRHRP